MAALSVSAVRQRVSTQVAALSGWTASIAPYDLFGRDGAGVSHRAFAVGTTATTDVSGRQSLTEGAMVRTTVAVKAAFKLRPKDLVASQDEGLDLEHTLIKQALAASAASLSLTYDGTQGRTIGQGDEFLLVDLSFTARHRLALS